MFKMTLALLLVANLMNTRAVAQEQTLRRNGLAKGKWSLSFSLEGQSSGSLGLSTCLSPKNSLGLYVSFGASKQHDIDYESSSSHLLFSPTFKRYFHSERQVVPHFVLSLNGGFAKSKSKRTSGDGVVSGESTLYHLGLTGGVGVEWFPVEHMSVRGFTGITSRVERHKQNQSHKRFYLYTQTSALTFSLYF